MLTVFRELLVNLAATVVADLSSPTGMIGYIFGIGLIAYWIIGWHRKRAPQGKRGVDSWYIIGLSLFVAALAIGTAAYGIGLRTSSAPKTATNTAETPPSINPVEPAPVPRTQPYRLGRAPFIGMPAASITRVKDGASIPLDIRNGDYAEYVAWLSVGNAPDPANATLQPVYAPRSPSDADREIPIIDKISDLLQKDAGPLSGWSFGNWQSALDHETSDAYFSELDSFRNALLETSGKLQDASREVPQFFDDDLRVIINPQKSTDAVCRRLERFSLVLKGLRDVVDAEKLKATAKTSRFPEVISPHLEEVGNAIAAYRIWVSWTQLGLSDRRRELSKIAASGTPQSNRGQASAARVVRIRSKYTSLVSDVSKFKADQKRQEPTEVPNGNREEWQKRANESMRLRNESDAIFMEKFSPRIVDLLGELNAAGVDPKVLRTPVWAINQWPDGFFQQIGAEINRLEQDITDHNR